MIVFLKAFFTKGYKMTKITLEKLIYKNYLKTSLASILFIELVLVIVYFIVNNKLIGKSTDFIIRDLTEGIEGMANSSRQDKIYLSATAGKYLLSKVYLTRGKSGDYQKSIDLVDDILKSSSNFSMTIASL